MQEIKIQSEAKRIDLALFPVSITGLESVSLLEQESLSKLDKIQMQTPLSKDITKDITDVIQFQETGSDLALETKGETFFPKRPPAKQTFGFPEGPGFPIGFLPRGINLSGGTDMGFSFIDPFARKRKHKFKNILEEMEDISF